MTNFSELDRRSFISRLESVLLSVFSSLKLDVSDYCDIQTVDGNTSIVLNNGALMTVVAYGGVKTIVGYNTFERHIDNLTNKLSIFLAKSGYQMGFVFKRDLNSASELYRVAEIKKNTARNLKLDLDYIIDEETEAYARFVYDESTYLVLITHPTLLDDSEKDLDLKKKKELFVGDNSLTFMESQDIYLLNHYLRSYHNTYVQAVLNSLSTKEFPVQFEELDVNDALRAIKKQVSVQTTDDNWLPKIPHATANYQLPIHFKTNTIPNDISNFLWQPLAEQLMRNTITGVNRASKDLYPVGSVITEGRIYAPLLIGSPPQGGETFSNLFNALNNTSTKLNNTGAERAIPFSVSFMMEGDNFSRAVVKKILAKILAVSSAHNSQINNAYKALSHYTDAGGVVVGLSMSAMTWAENNPHGIEEIQIRRAKLWRVLESWGGSQVIEKGGDPILGYTTNLLGINSKPHSPKHMAPLFDAFHLMPLTRPASPYKKGVTLNRSTDGALIKIEAFSALKQSWIKLYSGKSGSGKSLALNNDILDAFLLAGLKRLPYIFHFDVGFSGKGVIDMLHDHMDHGDHHLAVYRRFKNNIENGINPMECAVGRMIPTTDQIQQISYFLTTLITPAESLKTPESGISEFLSQIIYKTFVLRMDNKERSTPKRYERNVNFELDKLLEQNNITGSGCTYYELVDLCHARGIYRARDLAHRLAMPILADTLIVATTDEDIKKTYGNSITRSGGSLIDVFMRGITEAANNFPVFNTTTQFDIDTARIGVFDFQDVIDKNNPKKASLFYQICRLFVVRKILISKDDINDFPELYRPYYTKLVEDIGEDKKIFSYDEFHNTEGDSNIVKPVFKDGREGRKWNLEVKLSSQNVEDFGEMIKHATEFMIADRASDDTIKYLKQYISLNPEEVFALQNNISLRPTGLTYFSKHILKEADFSGLYTLTIPPKKYWCLTSDPDERSLREILTEMLHNDRNTARTILANKYPLGAKDDINRRKEAIKSRRNNNDYSLNDDEDLLSVTRLIAKDLINNFMSENNHQL